MLVKFEIPYPPSMNTYWRHTKSGHHYTNTKAKNFKGSVAWISKRYKKFNGQVSIHLDVYTPDSRNRDLDNLVKGVFDGLVMGGIIRDDNCNVIKKFSVKHCGVVKNGKVDVTIESVGE